MPSYQQFKITPLANATVSVPRFSIEAMVEFEDGQTAPIDLTGANALVFPRDLLTLYPTAAERVGFAEAVAELMIRKKIKSLL